MTPREWAEQLDIDLRAHGDFMGLTFYIPVMERAIAEAVEEGKSACAAAIAEAVAEEREADAAHLDALAARYENDATLLDQVDRCEEGNKYRWRASFIREAAAAVRARTG